MENRRCLRERTTAVWHAWPQSANPFMLFVSSNAAGNTAIKRWKDGQPSDWTDGASPAYAEDYFIRCRNGSIPGRQPVLPHPADAATRNTYRGMVQSHSTFAHPGRPPCPERRPKTGRTFRDGIHEHIAAITTPFFGIAAPELGLFSYLCNLNPEKRRNGF